MGNLHPSFLTSKVEEEGSTTSKSLIKKNKAYTQASGSGAAFNNIKSMI